LGGNRRQSLSDIRRRRRAQFAGGAPGGNGGILDGPLGKVLADLAGASTGPSKSHDLEGPLGKASFEGVDQRRGGRGRGHERRIERGGRGRGGADRLVLAGVVPREPAPLHHVPLGQAATTPAPASDTRTQNAGTRTNTRKGIEGREGRRERERGEGERERERGARAHTDKQASRHNNSDPTTHAPVLLGAQHDWGRHHPGHNPWSYDM
jgi:hypothetical protein